MFYWSNEFSIVTAHFLASTLVSLSESSARALQETYEFEQAGEDINEEKGAEEEEDDEEEEEQDQQVGFVYEKDEDYDEWEDPDARKKLVPKDDVYPPVPLERLKSDVCDLADACYSTASRCKRCRCQGGVHLPEDCSVRRVCHCVCRMSLPV